MTARTLIAATILSASLANAQQEAVVHQLLFTVSEELTTEFKTENKSRNWLPGYSISESMPENLLDSIMSRTAAALSTKLGMPVTMCFPRNKKGEEIGTMDVGGMIPGLPGNTFKRAKEECPGKYRYIDIGASIRDGGDSGVQFGPGKKDHSKMKPVVTCDISVYDADKEEVWGAKSKIKDLKTLRTRREYSGNSETTKSETLTPLDIYAMYMMALDMAIQQ